MRILLCPVLLSTALLGCHHHHSVASDGGLPDASMPDGATPVAADWAAARIQSPIPYDAPEDLVGTPTVLPGGRLVYQTGYDDGSWHLVVGTEDGASSKELLASTAVPGYGLQYALVVPEANGVLVLLGSSVAALPSRLAVVSLDGGSPTDIDTNVTTALVSADGTHVLYETLGATPTSPAVVRTSPLVSPAPTTLGMLDPGSQPATYDSFARSKSSATNGPFFYLVTGSPQTGMCQARAFGTPPAAAPHTITYASQSQCQTGRFSFFDGSANGRFVAVSLGADTRLVDTQTGTVTTSPVVSFSPDHTHYALLGSASVTIGAQDGTTRSVSPPAASALAPWSPDSSTLLFGGNGSTNCPYEVVTAATGAVKNGTSADCSVSTSNIYYTTLLADGAHALVAPPSQGFTLVDLTTGTSSPLQHDPTPGPSYVDTGDGIAFSDGWSVTYAKYDGSSRVRLDTPRAVEPPLDVTTRIADFYSGANAVVAYDASTRTVVFAPILDSTEALSWSTGNRPLAVTRRDAPATVVLTPGKKSTGQIEAFGQNFALFPAAGKVLFNSLDGSRGASIGPAIVSIGAITGDDAVQLGHFPTTGPYGGGELYSVGTPVGPMTAPTRVAYNEFRSGFNFTLQDVDGSDPLVFTGYRLRVLSPDNALALVAGPDQHGYVVPTNATATTVPKLVSGNVALAPGASCFGCTTSAWAYTDGGGAFTADGKLLLNGTAQGASAPSVFYVDPAASSPDPIDLMVSNATLLSDGETVVAKDATGALVVFGVSTPAQKKTFMKGTFIAASADATRMIVADNDFGWTSLSSVRIADGTVTSLVPGALAAGGKGYYTSLSSDGTRVYAEYIVPSAMPLPSDPCDGYVTSGFTIGTDGSAPVIVATACGSSNPYPTADFESLYYYENDTLYASQGGTPVALTNASETAQKTWMAAGDQLVVQSLDSEHRWHLFSIHTDGSGRAEIASPLAVQKRVLDVQLEPGHVVVDADAVTDGVLELFRFALPK